MNNKQNKAIEKLSKALENCKKENICFYVFDGQLEAFDVDHFSELDEEESGYDAVVNGFGVSVKDHHTIVNSGY